MVKTSKYIIAVLCLLLIIATARVIVLENELNKKEKIIINTAPPLIMVNSKLYWCGYDKIVDAPDESQIAGRITNHIPQTKAPETNDTSNTICCVNQPYAFVDGDLIVYAVNVHLSSAFPEHTVDAWFYCEPYDRF